VTKDRSGRTPLYNSVNKVNNHIWCKRVKYAAKLSGHAVTVGEKLRVIYA